MASTESHQAQQVATQSVLRTAEFRTLLADGSITTHRILRGSLLSSCVEPPREEWPEPPAATETTGVILTEYYPGWTTVPRRALLG